MTARRFRSAPTAPRRGMQIGVTLTPIGAGQQSPAQISAERARLREIEDAIADTQCAVPVRMRWRWFHFRTDGAGVSVGLVPDSSPPAYAYSANDFHGAVAVTSEGANFDAGPSQEVYDAWTEDAITIPLTAGFPNPAGTLIVDLLDADGKSISGLRNYSLGCHEGETGDGAFYQPWAWTVDFVQFEDVSGNIPIVTLDSDWRLVVYFVSGTSAVAGTLTISATDNVSPGGPFVFGPLVVTIGEPPP